ncbi:MAG: hypothetical protein CL843_03030 [Crocinitomicaceae bacterium]|nr:hypothetical protein [Crocinitomicaceae bacterium]|tara:strand:- start:9018 stop:11120 length:2103 start_codon:yes stop_codon:yes gene_type:complete
MARKKKQQPQKPKSTEQPVVEPKLASLKTDFSTFSQPLLVILILGFMLYAQTITYDYALDDKIVITGNQITEQGFSGIFKHFFYDSMNGFWAKNYGVDVETIGNKNLVSGGRYRPITMVTHSIEYGLFGDNPGISHIINALLYGLTGAFLFLFLQKLFPIKDQKWFWNVPFVATLIFICHPLHTEVVANIKGRDEILSFLFILISGIHFLNYIDVKHQKHLIYTGLFFALSIFSKETTAPFLILFPLTAYYFRKADINRILIPSATVIIVFFIYVAIRFSVLNGESNSPNELMNDPFLLATPSERLATIVLTIGAYLKLSFFPHPLTHDYYPFHLPFIPAEQHYASWSEPAVFITLVILLGLLILTISGLLKKSVLSYGILWYFGTLALVSNVLFPVGVFMNERFLYIPTAGLSLILGYYIVQWAPSINLSKSRIIAGVLGFVLIAFSVKTIARNQAWKNDNTLALTDLKISEGSAKVKMSAGVQYIQKAYNTANPEEKQRLLYEAIPVLEKSAQIHSKYAQALILLGKAYYELKEYDHSSHYFLQLASVNPFFENKAALNYNISIAQKQIEKQQFDAGIALLKKTMTYYPNDFSVYNVLGMTYGRYLQDARQSEQYLLKAYQLAPENADVLMNIGTLYAQQGKLNEARTYFEIAVKKVPNNLILLRNLASICYNTGDRENFNRYNARIQQLEKNSQNPQ